MLENKHVVRPSQQWKQRSMCQVCSVVCDRFGQLDPSVPPYLSHRQTDMTKPRAALLGFCRVSQADLKSRGRNMYVRGTGAPPWGIDSCSAQLQGTYHLKSAPTPAPNSTMNTGAFEWIPCSAVVQSVFEVPSFAGWIVASISGRIYLSVRTWMGHVCIASDIVHQPYVAWLFPVILGDVIWFVVIASPFSRCVPMLMLLCGCLFNCTSTSFLGTFVICYVDSPVMGEKFDVFVCIGVYIDVHQ